MSNSLTTNMLGTIIKPLTLGITSMNLQVWMRWTTLCILGESSSCSGSGPIWRPTRSINHRAHGSPTLKWRCCMCKWTASPWHLISFGDCGHWSKLSTPPLTLTSWDTQFSVSASTSRWNQRWRHCTFQNNLSGCGLRYSREGLPLVDTGTSWSPLQFVDWTLHLLVWTHHFR